LSLASLLSEGKEQRERNKGVRNEWHCRLL
jgi:hypothetical protein